MLNIIRRSYDRLVGQIKDNVIATKEEVRGIADRLETRSAGPDSGEKPSGGIPLVPERKYYPNVGHWEQGPWQASRNRDSRKELDLGSPIISSYMEDKNGEKISEGIKNGVRQNIYTYWTGLFRGKAAINWGDLDLDTKEAFRNKFENKYPWLRLCEEHWKVDHLWINYFGSWKRTRRPSPAPESVITSENPSAGVSSETEVSDISTGSKHGREEPEGLIIASPKRLKVGEKGKAREAFAPTQFHHSRPVARKKVPAKLSKVSHP